MKRSVAVVRGSALAAGVALGVVAFAASDMSSAFAGQTGSSLRVVSSWSGRVLGKPAVLQAGSLADARTGYVLLKIRGEKQAFFATPEGAGPLQLVSHDADSWIFRTPSGARALLENLGQGYASFSFGFLGRRLDPEKLGPLGAHGVAVPVSWGAWQKDGQRADRAVVLVEQTAGASGWKVLGYLPGFSLPQGMPRERALQRPLLGPGGHLYAIDGKGQRLVRQSRVGSDKRPTITFGCSSWPAPAGGSYRACSGSIVLHEANGASRSILRRHVSKGLGPSMTWGVVAPSPNGKWLLVEDQLSSCGTHTWADFLPSRGGHLTQALPVADTSEALGWLPDNSALVAGQAENCDTMPPAGIYQVRPGSSQPTPQLVLAAPAWDATTWGFAR